MKYLFRTVLTTTVFIEFAVFTFVGYGLYIQKQNEKNILGATTIVPVRKEYLISSPSAELQYFYESAPSMQQEDQPEWIPYKVVYSINLDTLNERYDYNIEKSPNVFRIITLGDSFTFGHYVSTKDNWTEKLEDKLNVQCLNSGIKKIEVINLGERGYDVQYAAHRYKIRGVKYHPDLILWFESGSGFGRLREFLDPLIERYKKSLTQEEESEAEKKHDYHLAWTKADEEIRATYSPDQISWFIYSAWKDFFTIRGTTPTIIATFSYVSSYNQNQLINWTAGQPNMSLFFGIRDIEKNSGKLLDGHPSVHGHRMIAEDLFDYLQKNKIVECR